MFCLLLRHPFPKSSNDPNSTQLYPPNSLFILRKLVKSSLFKYVERVAYLLFFAATITCLPSCTRTTTTDVLPDSCQGVLKIDFPRLVPKLLLNRPIIDSIRNALRLPIDEMGINFLQPGYLFQMSSERGGEFYFLLGISDDEAFKKEIAQKHSDKKVETHGKFSSLWISEWQLIWNSDFLIGLKTDPLVGKPAWNEKWLDHFSPIEKNETEVPPESSSDISFFWNINEEFVEGKLPPLEVQLNGNANWNHPNFVLDASVEEHQYLALLKPFEKKETSVNRHVQMLLWPAMESILLQVESYGGNAFKNEMNPKIIDLIKKMDNPFECLISEDLDKNLTESIQVKAQFSNQNIAQELEKEVSSMLPGSIFKNYSTAESNGELVFFHQVAKPVFGTYSSNQTGNHNFVFGLSQKNEKVETNLSLTLKKPGYYNFSLKIQHPENLKSHPVLKKILFLEANQILSPFFPNQNEIIP